jgi:homoserine kinase type II
MASYTQISLDAVNEILKLYGLNAALKLTPLSLGISNSNYRVDLAEQSVLLKISNDKNQKELNDEQEILLYLKSLNYEYSLAPYSLLSGELVYLYENYFGVIYPFVEGIPPGPSDYTCQEVGKAMAKLHSLNYDKTKLTLLRRHEAVGFGAKEILSFVNSSSCPEDFKLSFKDFFPEGLDDYLSETFATGIIHGDLYYDNSLFHHDCLSAVLDFEQAGVGEFILDIGISISGTCLEKGRIITPLVNSYLQGYQSVRPMPVNEKKFLSTAIILGLLSISLWRIKRFRERNLNPQMADSYRDLLTRATHFKNWNINEI